MLDTMSVLCLAKDGAGHIFAGTSRGCYRSTDDGVSWGTAVTGMGEIAVRSLAFDSEDYLYAASRVGVFRSQSSIVSSASRTPSRPSCFSLEQNHPKPFKSTTVIRYQLPVVSDAKLVVYDILGREVSVLVNERRDAGVHDVKLDATGLSSGVYFYQLRAGEFVQTKKLLLVH
jgi:ligand-binding sensor domain-containing protein